MEPLKFDPARQNIGESFGITDERNDEMCREYALIWHELLKPTKELEEKGLNMAEGLYRIGSVATTPEELLLAGYSFGRKMAAFEHKNSLAGILSKLKGE